MLLRTNVVSVFVLIGSVRLPGRAVQKSISFCRSIYIAGDLLGCLRCFFFKNPRSFLIQTVGFSISMFLQGALTVCSNRITIWCRAH